jgi:hypothetical protein
VSGNGDLRSWHCEDCGIELGKTDGNGLLYVGDLVISLALFNCGHCGHRKSWRQTDVKLDWLIQRVQAGRKPQPALAKVR